jgi:toxin-antitoxin system PIN domain toxin
VSYAIDANLLIYAVNQDSEFHGKALHFIEKCAKSSEAWLFPWPVATAFIRIVTHSGILPRPLAPSHAISTLEQILELPQVTLAGEESDDVWDLFSKDIASLHLRGNAITDALIVSIMRSNGISTIFSKDRDFLRFPGIKVVDPLK